MVGALFGRLYTGRSTGSTQCGRELETALEICGKVGFPVAEEKTVGPTTLIQLLGIEMDSIKLELRLPEQKLERLKELVENWKERRCCKKRELQSLAVHLNHACKVCRSIRRFWTWPR